MYNNLNDRYETIKKHSFQIRRLFANKNKAIFIINHVYNWQQKKSTVKKTILGLSE
jgi:hypothetical protein